MTTDLIRSIDWPQDANTDRLELLDQAILTLQGDITALNAAAVEFNAELLSGEIKQALRGIEQARKMQRQSERFVSQDQSGLRKQAIPDESKQPLYREVRAYLRTLAAAEREAFITAAISTGDVDGLNAIVTAPAYLSGVTAEQRQAVASQVVMATDPDEFDLLAREETLLASASKELERLTTELTTLRDTPVATAAAA